MVVEKVRTLKAGQGLDAATGEYTDMISVGIIDPVKVTRSALQNAGSIAAMVLLLSNTIPFREDPHGHPAHRRRTR